MSTSPAAGAALTLDSHEKPEGWALVSFRDVCEINPPKPRPDVLPPTTLISFVPMVAVDADRGAITDAQPRPFAEVRRGYTAFRDNDVILAKITPCMENGKAAIARGLQNGLGFGSTEFHVLRSNGAVLPEYLYHFIRQESFRRAAEENMTGSVGQRRVPVEFLEDSGLPLPPLAEQRRIVAKVEALLSRVKTAREHLARVPTILKRFRQSVLAAACSGRLTEDWRTSNEREDWSHSSLGERGITARIGPFGSLLHRSDYAEGGVPLVNPTHIKNGEIHPSADCAVSEAKTVELSPYRLETGDIVIGRRGEMGRVAVVRSPQSGYLCGTGSMFIRPNQEEFDPDFLCLVLRSPQSVATLEDGAVGSTMSNLNQKALASVDVPDATLAEQAEVVSRVKVLFNLADAIEGRIAAAATRTERMTQAILAKAFRGELVPTEADLARREGRDYEPASVLLQRLRENERRGGKGRMRPRSSAA